MPSRGSLLWIALAAVSLGATARDVSLIDAVKAGDERAVRALIVRADVNATEADGSTALHWAVHRDDEASVELLLRSHANARAVNRLGVAPLVLACTNGNARIAQRLLDAGADPNTTVPGGETVLMTAARTGEPAVIRLLMTRGARVDTREETRGQTALMWAAAEGNAMAVDALVAGGADIHAVSSAPASVAAGGARNRVDAFTPFLFAVRAGRLDAARALLRAGVSVNETAADGTSALVIAMMNAQWDLASALIDAGADPNASRQGWTPLHQAARTRTLSISLFPHPEATGRLSGLDVARQLIAHGANVDARMTARAFSDVYRGSGAWAGGATPFLVAAKGVDHEMMRLLVAAGTDPRATNGAGTTALMLAAGVDMSFIGEDSGTNEDSLAAVRLALELGVDVNATNQAGQTALHGAARKAGNLVQALVDAGARLDVHTQSGLTPLMVAHGAGQQNVVTVPDAIVLLETLMKRAGLPVNEPIPGMAGSTR